MRKIKNGAKLSQEEFEERLIEVYDGKIIALEPYVSAKHVMRFYCTEKDENGEDHGEFTKTPYEVINLKRGCNKCKGIENYKPSGFWNVFEHCYEEAKKYQNKWDLQRKCNGCYDGIRRNGWMKEIEKLYNNTTHYEGFENKVHLIYVYEIEETKTCYVGRTKNLKRRDRQHRRGWCHKHEKVYDNLFNYCQEKGIEMPQPKVIVENLNAIESQDQEDLYVKTYREQRWNVLNVAPTGKNIGSLGAILKWTYEACKEEAKKYSCKHQMQLGNQPAYASSVRNGWINEFFKNKKKDDGYWKNINHILEAARQCSGARDMIKKFGGAYNTSKEMNLDLTLEYGKDLENGK